MKAKMFVWIIAIVLVALIIVLLVTPKKTTKLPIDIEQDTLYISGGIASINTLTTDLNTTDLDSIDSDLQEIESLV
jgi:membrane protein YdbS with pleckstrin-like domain